MAYCFPLLSDLYDTSCSHKSQEIRRVLNFLLKKRVVYAIIQAPHTIQSFYVVRESAVFLSLEKIRALFCAFAEM